MIFYQYTTILYDTIIFAQSRYCRLLVAIILAPPPPRNGVRWWSRSWTRRHRLWWTLTLRKAHAWERWCRSDGQSWSRRYSCGGGGAVCSLTESSGDPSKIRIWEVFFTVKNNKPRLYSVNTLSWTGSKDSLIFRYTILVLIINTILTTASVRDASPYHWPTHNLLLYT